MNIATIARITIAAAALSLAAGCGKKSEEAATPDAGAQPKAATAKTRVAFVTNTVADFWVIAEAGAKAAAAETGVDVAVLMPAEGISDQKRMIEDQLTKGVKGVAVSPIDPANQTEFLDKVAQHASLITHDSDAPDSRRLAFIGVDNYAAGRAAGELVKEALPNGGKIAIFVGRMEQDNARRRRQGLIDEVLGRSNDPSRFDPPDAQIKQDKWHIVGTYTDQSDRSRGKANVEDVLSRHPDLAGAIGLFAYNPPLILEALKVAGKLNQVKVIGFDEQAETLAGVRDGSVFGSVVQDPYMYGYKSVQMLAALAQGKSPADAGIPESKFVEVPARKIRKDNVDAFEAELKKNLGK
jgi:ribose transport system substrate-binding protein